MENSQLWKSICEVGQAIGPHYAPVFDDFAARAGLDSRGLGLLLAALTFEPGTISPSRLQIRSPYTAAANFLQALTSVAEKGFFIETEPGEFRLTPSARAQCLQLIEVGRMEMDKADPLPHSASQHIASMLDKIVHVSLVTPPPPSIWSLSLSCKLLPEMEPPLPYIEQLVSCLHAYRDDAHLAAWQNSGLSAPAIETLTFLWRGDADSLDALCEELIRRGHPREVYAAALEELRRRGYLQGIDNHPQLTPEGMHFREAVEQDTNRCFFAPWVCLNGEEKQELFELLGRLRDGLQVKVSGD